mmetsp:Transcript_17680/g.49075  ORF Transcript_17680/g.49075 Transcript_17680/m.49075 type:complete len:229 (-) Transcript_17680:282-968(-)
MQVPKARWHGAAAGTEGRPASVTSVVDRYRCWKLRTARPTMFHATCRKAADQPQDGSNRAWQRRQSHIIPTDGNDQYVVRLDVVSEEFVLRSQPEGSFIQCRCFHCCVHGTQEPMTNLKLRRDRRRCLGGALILLPPFVQQPIQPVRHICIGFRWLQHVSVWTLHCGAKRVEPILVVQAGIACGPDDARLLAGIILPIILPLFLLRSAKRFQQRLQMLHLVAIVFIVE